MISTTKAVILAGGRGTRMRRADAGAQLSAAQAVAADSGEKGMIAFFGRPFLDYVVSALADAGITDVCLVVGPEHQRVRAHFGGAVASRRIRVHFAVQREPRGSADALLAAESFAGGEHVLVLNSDNYYPTHTLRALRELGVPGLAAFERNALLRLSNINAERIAGYSIVRISDSGMLERITEKPDPAVFASTSDELFVGMNSWSFPPSIFEACRLVSVSARAEFELPDAVQYAIDEMHMPFRVLTFHDGVLDLSSRGDIASVAAALRDVEVRL